jgi:hypothetical protein
MVQQAALGSGERTDTTTRRTPLGDKRVTARQSCRLALAAGRITGHALGKWTARRLRLNVPLFCCCYWVLHFAPSPVY